MRQTIKEILFEQIFTKILEEYLRCGFVDSSTVFVDATHIKKSANKRKVVKTEVAEKALFYEEELKKEINDDRQNNGKKSFKYKDDGGGENGDIDFTPICNKPDFVF